MIDKVDEMTECVLWKYITVLTITWTTPEEKALVLWKEEDLLWETVWKEEGARCFKALWARRKQIMTLYNLRSRSHCHLTFYIGTIFKFISTDAFQSTFWRKLAFLLEYIVIRWKDIMWNIILSILHCFLARVQTTICIKNGRQAWKLKLKWTICEPHDNDQILPTPIY